MMAFRLCTNFSPREIYQQLGDRLLMKIQKEFTKKVPLWADHETYSVRGQ